MVSSRLHSHTANSNRSGRSIETKTIFLSSVQRPSTFSPSGICVATSVRIGNFRFVRVWTCLSQMDRISARRQSRRVRGSGSCLRSSAHQRFQLDLDRLWIESARDKNFERRKRLLFHFRTRLWKQVCSHTHTAFANSYSDAWLFHALQCDLFGQHGDLVGIRAHSQSHNQTCVSGSTDWTEETGIDHIWVAQEKTFESISTAMILRRFQCFPLMYIFKAHLFRLIKKHSFKFQTWLFPIHLISRWGERRGLAAEDEIWWRRR